MTTRLSTMVVLGAALAAAGIAGCGSADATRAPQGASRPQEPLAWQRAVRVAGDPQAVRIVYVGYRETRAVAWTLEDRGGRHLVTLSTPRRRGFTDAVAVAHCVTLRAPAFADRKPLRDGATAGKPAATRRTLHAPYRSLARRFAATDANCPALTLRR